MADEVRRGLAKSKYAVGSIESMNSDAFFDVLKDLTTILAMLALGMGFLYIFISKPDEKS